MKHKRIISLLLAVAALTSLTACAGGKSGDGSGKSDVRTVKVAVAPGFYPITYADDNGEAAGYDVEVFKAIDEQYHMKAIARTVRYVHSGSNNSLKAFYYADGKTYESKTLNFEIVDRVGGGDAFSSGLIYALMQDGWKHEDIVNFAVASSVMKHAIRGDTNITSVDQIKRLMNNASFDVQR